MTDERHPHFAALARKYGRELRQLQASSSLDARIADLVATPPARRAQPRHRVWPRPLAWAAAAGLAVAAISAGIVIGVRLERTRDAPPASAAPVTLAAQDFAMWPSDSIALTVPAEYSPRGTLVAVNPGSRGGGERFWIDVVVSNDGTVRIERIVPAGNGDQQRPVDRDDVTLHVQ